MRELVQKSELVLPKNREFEVELILSDANPTATPQDQFRRSDLQPGYRLVPRARGAAESKRDLRPGSSSRERQGRDAAERDHHAAARGAAGSNGHLVYVVKDDGTAELRPVVSATTRARRASWSRPACEPATGSWSTAH